MIAPPIVIVIIVVVVVYVLRTSIVNSKTVLGYSSTMIVLCTIASS